jgi:hypothetical protein
MCWSPYFCAIGVGRGGGEEVYVAWGVHAIERINAPAVSGVFE